MCFFSLLSFDAKYFMSYECVLLFLGVTCICHSTTGLAILFIKSFIFFLHPVNICVKKGNWEYPAALVFLYLYVCFGFVEQAQGGVAVAVRSQGYEGLQPLQTQPQVSSSAKERQKQKEEHND